MVAPVVATSTLASCSVPFGAGVGASRARGNTSPSGDTLASRRPRPMATPAAIVGTAGRPAVVSTAATSAAGQAVARPALH
jgi:hypothetical protein